MAAAEPDARLLSPEDLQATVDLVGAGVSHLSLNMQVVWANPFYCRYLGYTLDELRSINIRDTTYVDDRPQQAQNIGRLLAGEAPSLTWEKRFVCKDGRVTWGRITASVVRDQTGTPRHLVAITSDIDALKAAEQELVLSRRQLEDAEAIADFGSWERDLVAGRLNWSGGGYRLFGLDPRRTPLTFELFLSMVHPDDRERLKATLDRAFKEATDFEIEYRIARADGTPRVVHVRGRIFKDETGKAVRTIGTMQDVTERRRQEQTIREQQQALAHSEALAAIGSLAASVAHEINNPLAWVLLELEAALAQPEQASVHVSEALGGVRRVGTIVKTLRGLSGLQTGELGPLDLSSPLEAALSMAWNGIHHKASVVRDYQAVPRVIGDDVRLAQVFLNLLVNAGHAIGEGGPARQEIRVVVRPRGDYVTVEIRDSGCGIPPEHLGRIFEPFFSTRSSAKGTGLGLPISRKIVEEAGGRIEVHSEVGQGSSFTVWLRVATQQPTRVAPPSVEPVPDEQPVGRVLVIDDERLIRRAVVRALPKCQLVEAESGDQARALLETDRTFDLVLCDMMMPGLSGMELHAWLAQVDPALAGRMVFITGGAFTAPARAFLDRADIHRLEKPFDGVTLRRTVRQLLAR